MLTETDIERAARAVIKRKGIGAGRAAEQRIIDLSSDGQAEAAATWQRIQRAIEVMLERGPQAEPD